MGYLAKRQEMGQDLEVRYSLATDPGREHRGIIKEVQQVAEVHGDEGSTVTVKVNITEDDLAAENVRAGAEVSAKVLCGRRPVGFVWFHDLVAFLEKMWFRFF